MEFSEQVKSKVFQAIMEQGSFLGILGSDGIIEFLNLIWPLQDMPSEDSRYDNAEGDAYQHLINNNDWEYDYLFNQVQIT